MSIGKDEPQFWDTRTLERRIRKGQVTRKDYDKHLKTLTDVAEKVAPPEDTDIGA
jgi:hypothetical protein